MLANEDPLSKVCCNQKMPLFYFIFVFFFLFPFPPPPPFFCSFCLFVFFLRFFSFFSCLSHFTQVALPNTAPPPPAAQRCRSWAATPCSPPPAAFPPPQPLSGLNGGLSPLCPPSFCPPAQPSSGEVSSHLPSLGDHVVESPNYYYCSSRVLYITGCPPPPNPSLHSSCTPQNVQEQGNSC